jgi:hypothetical protein
VYASHRRLRSTGFHFLTCHCAPSDARRRSLVPLAGRRRHSSILENILSSLIAFFSATALLATGLLFILQMFEDFRDA